LSARLDFSGEPPVNPGNAIGHQSFVMRSILLGLALLGAASKADMLWDFKDYDARPGNVNGIYAYFYPNAKDSASHKTPAHTATIARVTTGPGTKNGTPGARLDFVLDGENYPSAGIGLMFPEAQPLDLRMMKSIRVHLSANKSRRVRLSLSSHDTAYQSASDSGVSLGIDTAVGPDGIDWEIPAMDLTWPRWAADIPAVDPLAIFASIFAIQLNVSCQTKSGTCSNDSGWVFIDSLRLVGVGGAWPSPAQGVGCHGDSTNVSQFTSGSPKRNPFGGWWYAFTDVGAADSNSRGQSRIVSAPDTTNAGTWTPDAANDQATIDFRLNRVAPYSGFVGLETQFGPPDAQSVPVPVSIPDLAAISFDLEFGAFSSDLGGISFHVKKAGRAFQDGKEHQVRIPYTAQIQHWCIDLASLQQPPWTTPSLAFTPTDLLAMSWEAKLQGSAPTAQGVYTLRNIKAFRNNGVGVKHASRLHGLAIRRSGGNIVLERAVTNEPATALLVDARGRTLGRLDFAAGMASGSLPRAREGLSWIVYRSAKGSLTLSLGL